jgi:hypothetical protein
MNKWSLVVPINSSWLGCIAVLDATLRFQLGHRLG